MLLFLPQNRAYEKPRHDTRAGYGQGMDDNQPRQVGTFDLAYGMSPEEFEEMDAGRFMCADCGEFYAPDGGDNHTDCPSPRDPRDYPPGLLN